MAIFPSLPSRAIRAFGLLLPALFCGFAHAADDASDGLRFFETEVRPILANRCYECHGPDKKKGGLRLDNLSDFRAGGNSGPVVVAGKPKESLLIEGILHTDPDFSMPPEEKLPAKEIAVLQQWVAQGAPWPQTGPTRPDTEESRFSEEDRKYWAFQPLAKVTPPARAKGSWGRNEIDAFIAARHVTAGLTPAAEADRSELVRRVYFDLHGLPPTPEQSAAFVNDPDPQAYDRLLDTLLASPRYGERWAQHWLDLVRFAESDGYNQDAFRPAAWPYRDWVIDSFNRDRPYDEFVRLQLAGDEIAPGNLEILPATSFLRNGIYEYNLRDIRGQWDAILNDITDVAGEAFLGLSFSCARCHNHKFDPILQADYFSLRAFFEPVLWRTDMKLANDEQIAEHAKQQAAWEAASKDIRDQIHAMVGKKIEDSVTRDRNRFPDDIRAMVQKPDAERSPLERQYAMMAERMPAFVREGAEKNSIRNLKTDEEKKRFAALQDELKKFDDLSPKPLMEAFVATDAGPEAPPTKMKTRRGEQEVQPAFLTILNAEAPEIRPLPNSTGRRTALANWITRPDNPLSTRVIANRIWQYHFGRGIAGTPNDLGRLGEKPTHPELLDWLSQRFVADGWSFKKLHKLILQSATYRQTARRPVPEIAAKVDPANTLLWRFSPLRLDAEQVRDAMLLASGELDFTAGGPSTDANSSPRRTIYTIKKRNSLNELLRSLDAPAGFTSSSDRQRTTTATQALLMMNGDWPLARARRLAASVRSPEDAWLQTLGRKPTAAELARATHFLEMLTTDEYAVDLVATGGAVLPGQFKPDSPRERLQYTGLEREGEDFSVEAIVQLDSYAPGEGVRTIASRWNGGRSSVESCGWSLDIAGAKAAQKPGTVLMRLVGVDENDAFAFEAIPSNIQLALKTPYYVGIYLSSSDHTVTFQIRNLQQPDAKTQTVTVKHLPLERIGAGRSPLVIGGIAERKADLFHGRIEAVRLSVGPFPSEYSNAWETWEKTNFLWNALREPEPNFTWLGVPVKPEERDPRRLALADFCHLLLNTSEFLYLH